MPFYKNKCEDKRQKGQRKQCTAELTVLLESTAGYKGDESARGEEKEFIWLLSFLSIVGENSFYKVLTFSRDVIWVYFQTTIAEIQVAYDNSNCGGANKQV